MTDLELIITLDGWNEKSPGLYWRLEKCETGTLLEFKKANEFKYDDIESLQRVLDKFNALVNLNEALEIEALIYNDLLSETKIYMDKKDVQYAFQSLLKLIKTFITL